MEKLSKKNEFFEKFEEVVKKPNKWLTQWKKDTGKKIVGCFPMYIPEEIVHAAGMLPVQLLGSDEKVTLGDKYCHAYICDLVRGNFDLSLKGKLDYLDGIIFSDYCLTEQLISDIWIRHNPKGFYQQLIFPKNLAMPYAKGRLEIQFNDLKKAMEELSGKRITEKDLKNSISVFNQNKKLLNQIYRLRQDNPGLFRARDLANVVASSMIMPKEYHNRLLSELLEKIKTEPQKQDNKIRLLVTGSLCDMPELDILDLIEELGAEIIEDDLYVGRRYFQSMLDESVSPMEALIKHYIEDVPCPTKLYTHSDWVDYVSKLAKSSNAEGVVVMVLKYCEAQLFDIPALTTRLSREGMPNLILELHHTGASSQARVRLQAFFETIGGR